MRVRLTEAAISKAVRDASDAKKRIELADELLPGLRLRVNATGLRVWVLGMRDGDGKPRRFPLGRHPVIGISDARDPARALHQAVIGGADPIAERKRVRRVAQQAAQGEGTLRAVMNAYQAPGGAAPPSWAKARPTVERVFAKQLDRPAERLTVDELLLAADDYAARPSAALATRSLRPVLKWAAPRKLVPAELVLLQRREPVRRRDRVLSRDELGRVLLALRSSGRPHATAMLLMLLTLARREEVCGASWGEIDLDQALWTIPQSRTKNAQPHAVPLSRQAVKLLRSIRPKEADSHAAVFSVKGRKKDGVPVMSPIGNWDRETKVIQEASATKGWHRHDLRRTGATLLGDLGELPDIIEAALNHVSIRSPLAATYNRSRYRPQVANALQRLGDLTDALEDAPVVEKANG